ncbi:hypothetical protein V9T40_014053 [Parthenolecanium corni]|uniref:Uncharacterized protein n=1 Tax=Parthenolecanium corni TaxID=536013 RepID=A0AAN9Y328_9HEMI
MKWRNSKERELLASGGSREQTLPNKNNPNPDLSDADADRSKMDLSDVALDDEDEEILSNKEQSKNNLRNSQAQKNDGSFESTQDWSPDEEDVEINVT